MTPAEPGYFISFVGGLFDGLDLFVSRDDDPLPVVVLPITTPVDENTCLNVLDNLNAWNAPVVRYILVDRQQVELKLLHGDDSVGTRTRYIYSLA